MSLSSVDLSQVGKAVVLISVTDINDNAPSFAIKYQTSVCENAQPGQVAHFTHSVFNIYNLAFNLGFIHENIYFDVIVWCF